MDYKKLEDNKLIRLVIKNDNEALKELNSRYDKIYKSIISKSFYNNPLTRDELMGESFAFIYEQAKNFKPSKNTKFSTFLYSRTLWKCFYLIKVQKRKSVDISNELYNETNHEMLEIIEKELEKLDPRTKYIIKRKCLSEKKVTLEEIGDELNLTIEAVRLIYKKGLKSLRANLKINKYE